MTQYETLLAKFARRDHRREVISLWITGLNAVACVALTLILFIGVLMK